MAKQRLTGIRSVHYTPPEGVSGTVEATDVRGLLGRAGPAEFDGTQRLSFDLLVQVSSGTTEHTVDFTRYRLTVGDVLWLHTGQVHQWGDLTTFDGPVLMFSQGAISAATQEALRSTVAPDRNHWAAGALTSSAITRGIDHVADIVQNASLRADLRDIAARHALSAVLVELAALEPSTDLPHAAPPEAFVWFRELLEESYHHTRQVAAYAERLGYSTRTLNRLAQEWAGVTAKELIDERVMLEAKRALVHTDQPVAAIAEQLGFDDPSNFSAYFTHRAGMTPARFRATIPCG
ncbi:helix-turn-helix domain-containing protein [Nocardioides sp. Bht2]|uniref:helix-turn-helix domain-containing protein n=1 Tax=Nocardioides sp. Bht2 TaxID=3392297 RepID=UPI0039B64F4B